MTDSVLTNDARAKRNVTVLVIAQALLGAQMPMIFAIGGLAGKQLASNACFATLPISMIVFGSMTTAPWLSPFMQKYGRQSGFMLGASAGMVGAMISAAGLYLGNFVIFLIGSYLTGIYQSSQGFFRFAATDTASDDFKPKAISYVMAGGLVSAIVGPQLNNFASGTMSYIPFLASYLIIIGINLFGLFLFMGLDLPKGSRRAPESVAALPAPRSRKEMLRDQAIIVSIIVGMVSYALMNLVMTSTPLAVVGCGYGTEQANNIVTAHVLAMFVPSFFTGHLIARFGVIRIMSIGLVILAAAGFASLAGVQLADEAAAPSLFSFYTGLVLLGVGWNFGFIGATTLLAKSHAPQERGIIQGLNDLLVFGGVTVASVASGGLMNCSGGAAIDGWTAVNLAMVPFLTLAGGALIWLAFKPKS